MTGSHAKYIFNLLENHWEMKYFLPYQSTRMSQLLVIVALQYELVSSKGT